MKLDDAPHKYEDRPEGSVGRDLTDREVAQKAMERAERLEQENERLVGYNAAIRDTNRRLGDINATLNAALVASESGWVPPRPVPPQLATAVGMVVAEFQRAKAKHGIACIDGPYTNHERLAILMEEVGEAAHELTYDQQHVENGPEARLREELVQVAAMALGWLSALVPEVAPETPDPGPQMPADAAALVGRVTGRTASTVGGLGPISPPRQQGKVGIPQGPPITPRLDPVFTCPCCHVETVPGDRSGVPHRPECALRSQS